MSTTLTIQPSTIDNSLESLYPDENLGNNSSLEVRTSATFNERPILQFDFSALPAAAVVSEATLSLSYYFHGVNDPVGRTHWAYELTRTDWVELESTWNIYKTGSNWGAPGGDYTGANGASTTVPAAYGWMDWNVLALVQHFQSSHGRIANFLIRDGTENSATDYRAIFPSSEYTVNTTLCPKLVIIYTVPAIVLTAEAGSYSITGQAAGLRAARKLPADPGSYALTGQDAVLRATRKLPAAAGSYALAGQDAILRAARKLPADPGSYALAGQPVNLKLARKIAAAAGSYSLTGQDAVLRAMRKLAAAGGSYVLTGQDANLVIGKHYILTCEAGSYGEPYSKIFVTLDGRIYKKMGNTYLRLG